jgi:hypothetical protein
MLIAFPSLRALDEFIDVLSHPTGLGNSILAYVEAAFKIRYSWYQPRYAIEKHPNYNLRLRR